MGSIQNCVFCCRDTHIVISFAVLLISSVTHDVSLAEGRQIPTNTMDIAKGTNVKNGDKEATAQALIGSRPPRCEERCRNCGHCEAIQVPIAPQHKLKPAAGGVGGSHDILHDTRPATEESRGDYMTNYKPMSWRCKCGDFIFNP
ncbi:hypothetical protein Droror1_Dr00010138 [Drosera rotundifolia]